MPDERISKTLVPGGPITIRPGEILSLSQQFKVETGEGRIVGYVVLTPDGRVIRRQWFGYDE